MDNQEKPAENTWSRRKKIFILFIIISLVIHIIGILFVFNVSFRKHSIEIMQSLFERLTPEERKERATKRKEFVKKLEEIKLLKDRNQPAKLVARKSDFGWVFFEDTTPPAPTGRPEIPTTQEGPVATAPTAFATETEPQKSGPPPTVSLPESPAQAGPAPKNKPSKKRLQAKQKAPVVRHAPAEKKVVFKEKSSPKLEKITPASVSQPAGPKSPAGATPKISPVIQELPKSTPGRPEKHDRPKSKKTARKHHETSIEKLVEELQQEPVAQPAIDDQTTEIIAQPEEEIIPTAPTPEVKARIEKIVHLQEQLNRFGGTTGLEKDAGKPATTKVRGARKLTGKQQGNRNIIALTKGFVEKHEGEDGNDLIDRDGDDTKMPSFEEMKYISYEANINWCLQSSWKQNFAYNPSYDLNNAQAVIEFTLDEKGYVKKSEMLQSSGYSIVDSVIMKNLKCASPFPPLPKHFGVKEYTTGRIIKVYCNKFGL